MARVVVTETAQRDLQQLIDSRHLPDTTRDRVRAILAPLSRFPLLGKALDGRWSGFRVIIGPWPRMLILYRYDEPSSVINVVTIADSRTAAAPE